MQPRLIQISSQKIRLWNSLRSNWRSCASASTTSVIRISHLELLQAICSPSLLSYTFRSEWNISRPITDAEIQLKIVTISSFCFYFVDTSFCLHMFSLVNVCFWLYAYPFYKLLVMLIWVISWLTFPMTHITLVTRIFQWLTLWLISYYDFSWLILWLALVV